MRNQWRSLIFLIFRPESAESIEGRGRFSEIQPRSYRQFWQDTVKTLFWILISILAGLAIGQLN
ncbi:uncharacterized protein Dvar_84430 [Desulfosarcina variabilis str. Montpellier]|uniref:hypothetical protein n=1 Tax=Desulfosarcina variabilis TaxID=2300 RepID=UPI003AFA3DBA